MTFKQFLFILPFTAFCWLCELTFNLAVDIVQHSPAAQAAVGLLATGLAAVYVEPRPGQRFTWLPGTDAETTRKRLFGDD